MLLGLRAKVVRIYAYLYTIEFMGPSLLILYMYISRKLASENFYTYVYLWEMWTFLRFA